MSALKSFIVKWEMDVGADTPREAVERALMLLRSDAPDQKVFKVVLSGGHGTVVNLAKPADA